MNKKRIGKTIAGIIWAMLSIFVFVPLIPESLYLCGDKPLCVLWFKVIMNFIFIIFVPAATLLLKWVFEDWWGWIKDE